LPNLASSSAGSPSLSSATVESMPRAYGDAQSLPRLAICAASRYAPAFVEREITLVQALGWMLALAGSAAALSLAFLQLFADHEQRAMLFGMGGLALVVWAASHLANGEQHA